MAKKKKYYKFDPIIYPYKIWVAIGVEKSQLKHKFTMQDGDAIEYKDSKDYDAFTMAVQDRKTKKNGTVIVFTNKEIMTCNTIAHESSHATKDIFNYIGADIDPHETFEYLLGWIAECCEKTLKTKK